MMELSREKNLRGDSEGVIILRVTAHDVTSVWRVRGHTERRGRKQERQKRREKVMHNKDDAQVY